MRCVRSNNDLFANCYLPAPFRIRDDVLQRLWRSSSIRARLPLVSRRHNEIERHTDLIIGEHRNRLHSPRKVRRQEIPASFIRIEAQQIRLAVYFESHFWLPLTFLVFELSAVSQIAVSSFHYPNSA